MTAEPSAVDNRPLSHWFRVPERFQRSVHLPKDWSRPLDPRGYLVTGAIRETAGQILDELARPGGTRAWTITGPYGTGKSAFLLFLTDLLSKREPTHPDARELRRERLPSRVELTPLLIQAESAPLCPAILNALASLPLPKIASRARKLNGADSPSGAECALLLAEAANACDGGLLLIVDELGKYLEHAAARNQADVFFLQQLAESAARSDKPFLLLGALHSGFADYLSGGAASAGERAEWQKVQGRFHDLPFAIPNEQVLDLIGGALRPQRENTLTRQYAERIEKLSDGLRGSGRARPEALARLPSCAPLHPVTALLLWPLFRSKAAQNERSLFAFLTSHEPHGFRQFLNQQTAGGASRLPFFRLPDLYDYVAASLGSAVFAGTDARRWALIADSLERVPTEAPPLAADLIKAIGLLSLYGESAGLRADPETLNAVFNDQTKSEIKKTLATLEAESIVIWRRHRGAFGLWEGSDVDLDAALADALGEGSADPLHERLARAATPRPIAARAHSIRSGTLRWFEPRLTGPSRAEVAETLAPPTDADGILLFVIGDCTDPKQVESVARAASRVGSRPVDPELFRENKHAKPLIVATPRSGALAASLVEVEAWRWVREQVGELASDEAARREAEARAEAAGRRFEATAGPTFGLSGYLLDPSRSDWFVSGRKKQRIAHPRALQALLSGLCDDAYRKAPQLRNELLNRSSLSSAAAAGRRTLIEHILAPRTNGDPARLGIAGYSPEYSMFCALVAEGGFYSADKNGDWRFGEPTAKHWKPVWKEVAEFVDSESEHARPLPELIERLKAPPFGLREGPFPVLLTLFLRVRGRSAALYEDGVFTPTIGIETLERLMRRPETFAIRSYAFAEHERRVISAVADQLGVSRRANEADFIAVVRKLIGSGAKLPPFSRQTKRMSEPARRVRDLLLSARDPRDLLLLDLPGALGVAPSDKTGAEQYASALGSAVAEATDAYDALLDGIENALADSLDWEQRGESLRLRVRQLAERLISHATREELAQFLGACARTEGENEDWRTVIALPLADGLPADRWTDDTAAAAEARLRLLALEIIRLDDLTSGLNAPDRFRRDETTAATGAERLFRSWKHALDQGEYSEDDRRSALSQLTRHLDGPGQSPHAVSEISAESHLVAKRKVAETA